MNEPRKKYISPTALTPEQVVEMFKKSASGKFTDTEIAKLMHLSKATVSRILRRQVRAEVVIPHDYLAAVRANRIKSGPRGSRKQPPVGRREAITRYTTACYELAEAEEQCVSAGIDKEVLSTILSSATGDAHL